MFLARFPSYERDITNREWAPTLLLENQIQTVDDRFVRSVKYTKQRAQIIKRNKKIKKPTQTPQPPTTTTNHQQTAMKILNSYNNSKSNNDTITLCDSGTSQNISTYSMVHDTSSIVFIDVDNLSERNDDLLQRNIDLERKLQVANSTIEELNSKLKEMNSKNEQLS
ncbi:Uncharacterized protein APZ42_025153 [Daphnia magna]|uniref:Uncharacterized protein n=1 Tax=Daphnia magna TaxID=35525 RepID=A0A164TE78_9CRUS|nr:Uncharacterized protein APZ42_025153 [Daphnia magna]